MIRPMTSDVSALSGIVANGHQAIHFVSSAPSKIPYGGFSPVRLQTSPPEVTFRSVPTPRYRPLPSASVVHPLLCPVAWACAPSERAERRFRPARPVALGSASGYAVRQPLRLLWPHPRFCPPPPVSLFMPSALGRAEGPQFTLPEFDSVPPPLLRWLQDASREHAPLAGPSPILSGLGNHFFSAHQTTCGPFNEAATFT